MICWGVSIQSYETIIFFSNLWDRGSTPSLRAFSQRCYHLLVIFIWVSYCNVIANGEFSNNIIFPYVEMAFYKQYHPTLYTLTLYFINIFLLSWNGNRPTKHCKTNRGKSPQNLLLQSTKPGNWHCCNRIRWTMDLAWITHFYILNSTLTLAFFVVL